MPIFFFFFFFLNASPLLQGRNFIGKTNAEAPILWPPNVKNQHIEKAPDAGKD